MKKLVFLFVAFAAVTLASCGNKAANTEATVDSDSIAAAAVEEAAPEVDSLATDSAAIDTTATVAE